jgi:flagellar biosynthesis/type III secretory pathway protein FliH
VEELELQHKKRDWIYIQKSSIELATKTGLKQGLEQGLKQGLEQGEWHAKRQLAMNAYQAGLEMDMICKISGLDMNEVEEIIKSG